MKRRELEELIREELYKGVLERTVASRTPPRKMSGSQVKRRDWIGKKMKKNKKAVAHFKSKHGADWEYYLWATATNRSIDKGE